MAFSEDFVFGHGRDELLEEMYDAIDGYDDSMPSHQVAGVLWLDQQFGLTQPDDYVLITPGLAMWLIQEVTIVGTDLQRALEEGLEEIDRRITEQPFEIKFVSPHGDEYTKGFPENIRSKTVLVRVMNEHETAKLSSIYTVRANGEFIYLPHAGSQQPRTVQDLQA